MKDGCFWQKIEKVANSRMGEVCNYFNFPMFFIKLRPIFSLELHIFVMNCYNLLVLVIWG